MVYTFGSDKAVTAGRESVQCLIHKIMRRALIKMASLMQMYKITRRGEEQSMKKRAGENRRLRRQIDSELQLCFTCIIIRSVQAPIV